MNRSTAPGRRAGPGAARRPTRRALYKLPLFLRGAALLAAAPAWAQDPPTLAHCAAIGPAADRLACYDKLAGRAPSAPVPVTVEPGEPRPSESLLAPTNEPAAPRVAAADRTAGPPSLLSKYWELDPADKRGTFNFTGYRANYVMPAHYTSDINRAPQSPTQDPVAQPDYRAIEAKFQLSLRTKVAQDFGLPDADVWLAFTQQAMWQIWNSVDSKPFRNTDYEPEAIYMVPVPTAWQALGSDLRWRFVQLGIAHQSNGQSDPLSRSWNRVYLGTGFEAGNWSLTARYNHRIDEDDTTDNNPDLLHYRGRGELNLLWSGGAATASLLWRTSFKDTQRGSLTFEWTYPVFADQPNGVRWFVQGFTGYGETLTDYNFKQTSLGAGFSFLQF